jgi:hypothetical protein
MAYFLIILNSGLHANACNNGGFGFPLSCPKSVCFWRPAITICASLVVRPRELPPLYVIPVKTGIQILYISMDMEWIPAFFHNIRLLHSLSHGSRRRSWILAFLPQKRLLLETRNYDMRLLCKLVVRSRE